MAVTSYQKRLNRINKLTKRRHLMGMTQQELAKKTKIPVAIIKRAEIGYEVTEHQAQSICRVLKSRFSTIWVNFEGMIVVRERKYNPQLTIELI